MIDIVHASISENGNAGWDGRARAGDQGREVFVRKWYNRNWDMVLRHPNEGIAERAANVAYLIAESHLCGYDQSERNTLYHALEKYKFSASDYIYSKELTETDCSAFVTACFVCAGVGTLKYSGNAPTTRTMEKVFKNAGFIVLKDKKYLSSDEYLLKGDVLLKVGAHTVICLKSGSRARTKDDVEYFPQYKGTTDSIVTALGSLGFDYSKSYRKKIADANGITNYSGTASQNTKMLVLLKQGFLILPNQ